MKDSLEKTKSEFGERVVLCFQKYWQWGAFFVVSGLIIFLTAFVVFADKNNTNQIISTDMVNAQAIMLLEEKAVAALAAKELPTARLTELPIIDEPIKEPWQAPVCRNTLQKSRNFTPDELAYLAPIPEQIDITDRNYAQYRNKAAQSVDVTKYECAKFVNRLFLARFGQPIFGNAWDAQINKGNNPYINLVWRLEETRFSRNNNLALSEYSDRSAHYQQLYQTLDCESSPIGIIGFLYHFTMQREMLAANPSLLPQSHVVFLAGRKEFYFQNTGETELSLEQVISNQYGDVHEFEREFLFTRVDLEKVLASGEKYFYTDYLVEEHFRGILHGSLLELYLKKHRNNRVTPLLRPISYSRISDELIFALEQMETE